MSRKVKIAALGLVLALGSATRILADPMFGSDAAIERVDGNDTNVYYVDFFGGERGDVAIEGDGDTDLDLYVYDLYGNLLGRDIRRSDRGHVVFVPAWDITVRIEVRNLGSVYNEFVLRVF